MSSPKDNDRLHKNYQTRSDIKMIGIDFYNTWITISSGCRKFYLFVRFFQPGEEGGGACLSVLYRCVNKKKKTDEKVYFYKAGKCAVLSSFRV